MPKRKGRNFTQEAGGLTKLQVHSKDEAWDVLGAGYRAKNELGNIFLLYSLVRVTLQGHELVDNARAINHLWFIDMASSQVSDEAALLHTLSSCSNLQDTLSGDCKFIMLLHASTQLFDHAHTFETFEFANRIRRVEMSKMLGDNMFTMRRCFIFSRRHDYFKEESENRKIL
ncbi:unnamed protein product [Cochlearia groenlandica]